LAEICYELTKRFPKEEILGMIAQIRKAAIAVPANVAQGYGRDSKGDCVQFLMMSQGSLKELESHLILSTRVGILAEPDAQNALQHCERLEKMLDQLVRALQSS
jgi:four helix bundle protein